MNCIWLESWFLFCSTLGYDDTDDGSNDDSNVEHASTSTLVSNSTTSHFKNLASVDSMYKTAYAEQESFFQKQHDLHSMYCPECHSERSAHTTTECKHVMIITYEFPLFIRVDQFTCVNPCCTSYQVGRTLYIYIYIIILYRYTRYTFCKPLSVLVDPLVSMYWCMCV